MHSRARAEQPIRSPLPCGRCSIALGMALCLLGCSGASPEPAPPDLLGAAATSPPPPPTECLARPPQRVCSSDDFCWASPRPQEDELAAVWAPAPSNVWVAAGAGAVLHFDGHAWQSTAATVGLDIHGLWGSAAAVWAVGDRGAIRRWDGQRWQAVASGTTAALLAVWGSGPSDVWAVGEAGTIQNENYEPPIHTHKSPRRELSGKLPPSLG